MEFIQLQNGMRQRGLSAWGIQTGPLAVHWAEKYFQFLPAAEQVYKSFFSFSFFFFSFSNPRFFGLITILNQFMWLLTSRELWFSGKCDFPVKMWFPGKIWNSGKKWISRYNVNFCNMLIPGSDFPGKYEIREEVKFREEMKFREEVKF